MHHSRLSKNFEKQKSSSKKKLTCSVILYVPDISSGRISMILFQIAHSGISGGRGACWLASVRGRTRGRWGRTQPHVSRRRPETHRGMVGWNVKIQNKSLLYIVEKIAQVLCKKSLIQFVCKQFHPFYLALVCLPCHCMSLVVYCTDWVGAVCKVMGVGVGYRGARFGDDWPH